MVGKRKGEKGGVGEILGHICRQFYASFSALIQLANCPLKQDLSVMVRDKPPCLTGKHWQLAAERENCLLFQSLACHFFA